MLCGSLASLTPIERASSPDLWFGEAGWRYQKTAIMTTQPTPTVCLLGQSDGAGVQYCAVQVAEPQVAEPPPIPVALQQPTHLSTLSPSHPPVLEQPRIDPTLAINGQGFSVQPPTSLICWLLIGARSKSLSVHPVISSPSRRRPSLSHHALTSWRRPPGSSYQWVIPRRCPRSR
ncbi:hypothetical protein GGTG_02530 [Gaeumannomyces tritici R3-111a-1]|uniref:Uncharacterized protein n=1 Tax=Gaeumannomyces tritici (strain R3-111a-1) TaxID=644352 RepID=J3NMM4_GAET3|nr:hypothetical protein GGTG_02530 [Gaeumannomyces tritici R3-111a-1]EJT82557.1 hypothetical protein GGTG_02530 [Gaeumannomyces tritici R3-111a-1]